MQKHKTTAMLVIIIVLGLLVWRGCDARSSLESDIQTARLNLIALNDSMRIEQTRNGSMQFVKSALIADMKDLRSLNSALYSEVRNQRNTIFYIGQMTAAIRDSLKRQSTSDGVTIDPVTGDHSIAWNFDTSGVDWSRRLSGRSVFGVRGDTITPKFSTLDNFGLGMKITTGLQASEIHKGMVEIFVRSSYPNMNFSEIDGAIVNPEDFRKYLPSPKPKRYSVGPYVGVGYGVTLTGSPRLVPTVNVGVGVQLGVISF